MVPGGIVILAEVIGIKRVKYGIMNILSLVGGILTILAAKSMGSGSAPEPVDTELT